MIAFAQFRLPLSIAQYLNGPVLSSPVPFDRNMSELSYWIPALYGKRTYALSEGFRSLLLVKSLLIPSLKNDQSKLLFDVPIL